MSALLQQHDEHCWCRRCKPPLSPVAMDEQQATRAALIGGGVLVLVLGVIAGASLGIMGWR